MKKKTKIKVKSIIALLLLVATMGDLTYMLYNITFNAMATWFGCVTMFLDVVLMCVSYDYLEKEFNKNK